MQSCKLFGTSRLAGGFLFIQRKPAGIQRAAFMRREGRIHTSPSHPIDCIPFLVTSAVHAVSIKRRLGEPSKQHRGLKKLLANVKRPPNNAGHPPFSVLTRSLTGGFKFGNGTPRRQSIPRPFPYLVIKRAEDAEQPASPPHPMYSRGTAVTSQPQASPHLPFFLQFLHFSENRTAVDLKVPGDLGDAAVTFHRG